MKLTNEQTEEIKEQQSQENKTKRVTAAELEKILYYLIPILASPLFYLALIRAFKYENLSQKI